MDKRTLTALQGSIKKWEAIVAGTGADRGINNCPLCAEFYNDFCEGCPVRKKTKEICCEGSPYVVWSNETNADGLANTPLKKKLAQAELRFLKSLLP